MLLGVGMGKALITYHANDVEDVISQESALNPPESP